TSSVSVRRRDEAHLDEASRALVRRLRPTDWAFRPQPIEGDVLAAEIWGLETQVALDTERNERELHSQIHRWLTERSTPDLEVLNDFVFGAILQTPKDDPWLGLSTPGVFTGLPGDGVLK